MRIEQNKIDDLNATLEVVVEKDDYSEQVSKSIKDYRKRMNLKGFRQGMVPIGMVKKMIGNQVLVEEINKLLQNELDKYIREEKLDLLGYPLPNYPDDLQFDINKNSDYNLSYEIGLAPDVSLKYLDKKPKFTLDLIKIDDKMIGEEVDNMRKRYGTSSEAAEVAKEDLLKISLVELGEDGLPLEDGVQHQTSFPADMFTDKKVAKAVIGAKKGDVIPVADIFKMTDKDRGELARYILNVEEDRLDTIGKKFSMTIDEINRIAPAELNEEFFNQIYGEGVVKTEDEMKAKIREELENYFRQQSDRKLINDISEALIDNMKIELPEVFLRKWVKVSNEKPITESDLDDDFPKFLRNLRWSLILKKVARENGVEVSFEDVKQRFTEITKQQMAQYGLLDIDEERLEGYVQQMMQNREHLDKIRENLLEEKVLDVVKAQVTIKEKNVTLDQFNKSVSEAR